MASAASLVEKATSDMLFGPDWAMNLEICDVINGDPGQAKDVVKAVKKRLNNKNARVQLLALTVLETLIKNCGEIVHQHVAEKDVLHEMTKIVKKKSDMHVRDKILVLLDSWQEAFGGSRGKYPQYYLAFEELRRSGVEFPDRAPEHNVPIFTPPRTPTVSHAHGQTVPAPAYSSPRGEPVIPAETGGMSLADIDEARSGAEVLSEMLNAIDPKDKEAVVDEVIVDLLEKSRTYQKRVTHLVNTTSDEEMLRQGLSLNDELQGVIAKHDAIASGSPLPRDPSVPVGRFDQEEEGEEFSQLAHRSSRTRALALAGPQVALPPPPQQKKLNLTPSQREMTVDLLSGDSFHDTTPPPLASSSMSQSVLVSQPSQSPVSTNPFDSDPAFHALPLPLPAPVTPTAPVSSASTSNQLSPVDAQLSYMQPGQQSHFSPYPNGLNSPTSPPPYGYRPYTPAQGTQSYVAPWAVPNVNPQQPSMFSQNSQNPTTAQGVHPLVSAPWGANNSPSLNQQQHAQQQAPPQQMSAQQRAMLYGNNAHNGNSGNNGGSALPPPPGQHSLRQQFFQQKQNTQANFGATGDLVGQTQNLSLQDQSLYSQSQSYGGQPLQHQGGTQQQRTGKEVLPADRLFEDLVDLSNQNARFKAAGILSRGPSKNI